MQLDYIKFCKTDNSAVGYVVPCIHATYTFDLVRLRPKILSHFNRISPWRKGENEAQL